MPQNLVQYFKSFQQDLIYQLGVSVENMNCQCKCICILELEMRFRVRFH